MALDLFSKASQQDYAKAYYQLGKMYASGHGVDQNEIQSAELFRCAADKGYAKAQYRLGRMYMYGEGVEKDPELACQWLEKAAFQGYGNAQYSLGVCYAKGRGVPQDLVNAYAWLLLARERDGNKVTGILGKLETHLEQGELDEAKKLSREWSVIYSEKTKAPVN